MAERSVRNAAVIGVGLLVAIAIAPGTRSAGRQGQSFPQRASQAESLTAWEKIAKVLQHPRCINCHQLKSPLQGDTGRPHIPRVVRGPDGHGVGVLRCGNCHDQTGANPTSGIPSAPNWGLAPVSMLWQG
ncbi:MAG TPA: Isoquinoline 1-oxidoreductase subunit, partial [Blastocatellia bacterium]|nr:Isoquinoline 1-oxidoreductase subunit [Blastocatellia bacterium]